jgi:hypothetical protein
MFASFWETQRCDKFRDFSAFRKDLEKHIGKESLTRKFNEKESFSENKFDLVCATEACFHYHRWHRKNLIAALSWRDWIQYQTLDRRKISRYVGVSRGWIWGNVFCLFLIQSDP